MPSPSLESADADSKAVKSKEVEQTESWAGKRAFVFYPGKSKFAFDWLTQQPPPPPPSPSPPVIALSSASTVHNGRTTSPGKYGPTHGEFMLGGGAMLGGRADAVLFDNFGVADDNREPDIEVNAYLGGILPCYFSNWGPEGHDGDVNEAASVDTSATDGGVNQVRWEQDRVKAIWTGIMGISADIEPWVGRVPSKVSGRREVVAASKADRKSSMWVSPGEWIAAGYSGEGMANAWLCGTELARMMLGSDVVASGKEEENGKTLKPGLPSSFLISEKRWKKANIEDLMEGLAG